jgi:uncharacterized damage-inducible protein DinB
MREILMGLASYNRKANERLVGTLKDLPEGEAAKDRGAYYKSIAGTFEHLVIAEVTWLRRFRSFFKYASLEAGLGSGLIAAYDAEAFKADRSRPASRAYELVAEADALFETFLAEVGDEDLLKRVEYTNNKGERLFRIFWNLPVHILNHGTHHRGEISAMLDMAGVANDFSGFTLYTS